MHGLDVGSEAIEKEVKYLNLYVYACFGKYLGCFFYSQRNLQERGKLWLSPFQSFGAIHFSCPKYIRKELIFLDGEDFNFLYKGLKCMIPLFLAVEQGKRI